MVTILYHIILYHTPCVLGQPLLGSQSHVILGPDPTIPNSSTVPSDLTNLLFLVPSTPFVPPPSNLTSHVEVSSLRFWEEGNPNALRRPVVRGVLVGFIVVFL